MTLFRRALHTSPRQFPVVREGPTRGKDLLDALCSVGFAWVPAKKEVVKRPLDAVEWFFRQPQTIKESCYTPNNRRGYYMFEHGEQEGGQWRTTEAWAMERDVGHPRRLREAYFAARDFPESLLGEADTMNRFPTEARERFKGAMRSSFEQLTTISESLLQDLGAAIENDPLTLASFHSRQDHVLEAKWYPPSGTESAPQERMLPHADLSTLTLLLQRGGQGLEVWDDMSEAWVPAYPMEDAILVNTGDFARHWSRGLLASTVHRVRCPPHAERWSIAFFVTPNWETRLQDFVCSAETAQALDVPGRESSRPWYLGDPSSDIHAGQEDDTMVGDRMPPV